VIRSSKLSTKFANRHRQEKINLFIDEYKNVMQFFVDLLWTNDNIPTLPPKDITDQAKTWLSARAVQCAAKQASGVVRGTQAKNKKLQYIYSSSEPKAPTS
jgi:hypothetical protein